MTTLEAAQVLFDDVADWAEATFPLSSDSSRLAHLRRELAELEWSPESGEEMADLVLILCHQARAHGVQLAEEIARKFSVCQTRRWGPPDAGGVVEHVREEVQEGLE